VPALFLDTKILKNSLKFIIVGYGVLETMKQPVIKKASIVLGVLGMVILPFSFFPALAADRTGKAAII
jgi:hypothetical protein